MRHDNNKLYDVVENILSGHEVQNLSIDPTLSDYYTRYKLDT